MSGEVEDGFCVRVEGTCAIIHMNRGKNEMNLQFCQGFHKALDKVESFADVKSLVTVGDGRFYCNGLDLSWLSKQNVDVLDEFRIQMLRLLVRLLTFPLITVAALNGHCYAGGGLLALCSDYRCMQTKRGWFCLPEVKLGLVFRPWHFPLMRAKISNAGVLRDSVLFGARYTVEEAFSAGIVDLITTPEKLLATAVSFAREKTGTEGFHKDTLQKLKYGLYKDVIKDSEKELLPGTGEEELQRYRNAKL